MDKYKYKTTFKKKKCVFDTAEKKKLAKLIEMRPGIWDVNSGNYKIGIVLTNTWNEVASEMNKSVDECKRAWRSLKDGLRYRRKKKMNDTNIEDFTDENSDNLDWDLKDSLHFMESLQIKRSNSPFEEEENILIQNEDPGMNEAFDYCTPYIEEVFTLNNGNGTETEPSTETSQTKENESPTTELLYNLNEYISSKTSQTKHPNLKYYAMYANMDEMLKKLSEEDVFELNIEILTLIFKKIKQKSKS